MTDAARAELAALFELASGAGVMTSYRDWRGESRAAHPDVVLAVLRALGHELDGAGDAARALAELERRRWREVVPPVAVAWDGVELSLPVRVIADRDERWRAELRFESGRRVSFEGQLFELGPVAHARVDGVEHAARLLRLPVGELGYHRLEFQLGATAQTTTVLAAPTRAPALPTRSWGVFAPVYGLRDGLREEGGGGLRSGIGDLGALARLRRWASERGASYLGTLPLLAGFFDRPCEPSPYAPVSRLAWNELYLEPLAVPGADAPEARARRAAAAPAAAALRALPLIDYRGEYRLRRDVLEPCARAAWADPATRTAIEAFATAPATAAIAAYADFRASAELHGGGWSCWPMQQAGGDLTADRAAPGWDDRRRFHLWAQYALDRQLAAFTTGADPGAALYLDLPVGVSRDGFDTWAFPDAFVLAAAAGAPPDALFLGGQDWGLAPLHPDRLRAAGHAHWIDVVRHHVRHARLLRIDHVMGLHRLYWIPRGVAATDGVYVRYPDDELYAILCLEASRAGCALVGEDLGTVPDETRAAMARHGLAGLHVAQFVVAAVGTAAETPAAPGATLAPPPAGAVASLNTHDTPTFAGFWRGDDIGDRVDLGLITPEQALDEHAARHRARHATLADLAARGLAPDWSGGDASAAVATAMRGLTAALLDSDAPLVLLTLEDLWLEPRPQNVPGTSTERPNWRRPLARTLDQLASEPDLVAALPATVRGRCS